LGDNEHKEIDFEFYFGNGSKRNKIKAIDFNTETWIKKSNKTHRLKNRRLFGRIVWQSGVIKTVLKHNFDAVMLLADANILSTWIAALILKLKRVEISFWGHGLYERKSVVKKLIKKSFHKLADQNFVYSSRAKEFMVGQGFNGNKVHVVFNSLDYDTHLKLRSKAIDKNYLESLFGNPLPVICFIGRLTPVKKLDILIKAVHEVNKKSKRCNLLIIGSGSEEQNLKSLAVELLTESNYHFYGPCYEEKKIGKLLANSELCVSPGNIGLTAIHSLSYGTPVCSHSNFDNQMPESEAIIEYKTGILFRENDSHDLANEIDNWLNLKIDRNEIRKNCYSVIDNYYNPYIQIEIFRKVFLKSNCEMKTVSDESITN